MLPQILILSSELEYWHKLSGVVSRCGCQPVRCETIAGAKGLLTQYQIEVIVCDDVLPDGDFYALIKELKGAAWQTPVVVASRLEHWDSYLEALVAGAFDYVVYPPYPREVERAISDALVESKSHGKTMAQTAS
ncbi:MAG: hypothetical protein ACLQMT_01845 [Candidatus Acidiferrales bacterium]